MYTLDIIMIIAGIYGIITTIMIMNLNDDEKEEEKKVTTGHAYQ